MYSNAYNSLDYDQLSLEELKQYVDEEIDYSLEEWLSEDELSEIVEVYREVVNDWDRATEVEELIVEKNK